MPLREGAAAMAAAAAGERVAEGAAEWATALADADAPEPVWVALDDMDLAAQAPAALARHFLMTDGDVGLTEADAQEVRARVAAMQSTTSHFKHCASDHFALDDCSPNRSVSC